MMQFLVAVVALLACALLTIAIAVAVLKLSGDNWADWSAAPLSWGLPPGACRSAMHHRGPDRRTVDRGYARMPAAGRNTQRERRCGLDRRRQPLGAT